MAKTDLSIWEGDGLPGQAEFHELVDDLGLTLPEMESWIQACKREAWVHEKMAKYENNDEWHLAVARFFWRRTERLREYVKIERDAADG